MAKAIKTPKQPKEPVRVRYKTLSDGSQSVYLDIYRDGKRQYEFLKLYLIPETNAAAKAQNKATLAAVNTIKSQRIIELTNGVAGLKNTSLLSKMLLLDSDLRTRLKSEPWVSAISPRQLSMAAATSYPACPARRCPSRSASLSCSRVKRNRAAICA